MRTETLDIKLPIALNTFHDIGQLLPTEATINKDVVRLPSGELSTHPRWLYIKVNNALNILGYYLVDTAFIERQFLIFGHYMYNQTLRGFVGRIKAENITTPSIDVEILIEDLHPYMVPSFTNYRKGVYIFLGPCGIKYYDGKTIDEPEGDLKNLLATVGLAHRGRLWVAGLYNDPGVGRFTDIGTEAMPSLNSIICGDKGEMITGLMDKDAGILLFKYNEFYEYAWEDAIDLGVLTTRSRKAGCAYHTLLQKKFDTIYAMNKNGCYIINPKYIRAIGREVMVEPDVIDAGLPIRNLLDDFKTPIYSSKIYLYDIWNSNDFTYFYNLAIIDDNEKVRITLTATTINQQSTSYNEFGSINSIIRAGQSFQPSIKCFGKTMQLSLTRRTDESNPKIHISIFDDDGNTPGDELCGQTIDTSSWPIDMFVWVNLSIRDENGDLITFEKDTKYWVVIEDMGEEQPPENIKYSWRTDNTNPYARGNYWNSDTGHFADRDAVFVFYERHYHANGECTSKEVILENITYWGIFDVVDYKPDNTTTQYWLSGDDGPWYLVTPGEAIPNELKFCTFLRWKAKLSTTDNCETPWLDKVQITGICIGEGETLMSGFREDRYYLLGKDKNLNQLFLCYTPDGWMSLDKGSGYHIYGQCQDNILMNGYDIAGVGKIKDWDNLEFGCLFYAIDPDHSQYLELPTHIKSGQTLLDEVPKKGRRIFITYKGNNVVLKLHTKSEIKTFNLPNATTFYTKELNFGTDRTKYFLLEITATKNFQLKKMSGDFKFFKRNE